MIKIIIAEDNSIVRNGLVSFLHQEDDIEVIAYASNGQEVLNKLESGKLPDIVLTDNAMPVLNGLQLATYISQHYKTIKVIMLSFRPDRALSRLLQSAGIDGYVSKDEDLSVLKAVIRDVYMGKQILPIT